MNCYQIIPSFNSKTSRCIIDLQESDQKKIFHINIDPEKNQIMRNDSTPEKGYRNEETWGENPIRFDKDFKLKIVFHTQQYELQIGNKHFCSFHQRMPISLIKELVIRHCTVLSVDIGNVNDIRKSNRRKSSCTSLTLGNGFQVSRGSMNSC